MSRRFFERRFGEFPFDWETAKLKNICEVIADGTHFSPKSKEGPYKYVTSKNIRFGKIDFTDVAYISEEEHEGIYKGCPVQKGDLLITKDGANTGNAAINPVFEPFSLLSSVAMIRAKKKLSSNEYLLQFILSPLGQSLIQAEMAGQAITRITLTKIGNFELFFPPLPEQRKIAEILSTWDEAIAKTEQLIVALQTHKKGLMQRLLSGEVRFEGFVKSDEIQETRFGVIPADWEMKKVSRFSKVNSDALGNEGSGKDFFYVELSAVNKGQIPFPSEAISYDNLPSRARRIPRKHDVIMATVRPNLLGYATWDNELPDHLVSTGFALISPKSPTDKDFIYQSLYGDVIQRQIHGLVTGSNYPAINATEVKKLYLCWPKNPDERKKIGEVFRAINDEIGLHEKKLAALQQQKKGLMQRLLTGQVRVA